MSLLKKIAFWFGVFITSGVVFMLMIQLIAILLTSGLKGPIEKQLAAIRAENMALAYSYTTTGFQSKTSLDDFKKIVNEYSALRNNESISYNEREVDHGVGVVNATLISRGGFKSPVSYHLIKENDEWKIEGMVINPDTASEPTRNKKVENPKPVPVSSDSELNNYYQNQRYHFTIKYPVNWSYVEISSYGVAIMGQENTASSQSSVTVQYIGSQKRISLQQLIEQGKSILMKKASTFKIEEEGMLPQSAITNHAYQASYALYSYTINNQPVKQMEVIYYTNPNRVKYVIDYISTADQFDVNLPMAKAMVRSFSMP
jgi:Domain of unknown function (DUF4864)